jgi:hypothetical protein
MKYYLYLCSKKLKQKELWQQQNKQQERASHSALSD